MKMPFLKFLILTLLIAMSNALQAADYDPLLLQAQASIFPKIIMLDKQVADKTIDNEIVISIISNNGDVAAAEILRAFIEKKYKNKLGSKKLTVKLNEFVNHDSKSVYTAYILLKGTDALFKTVVTHASNKNRIVFSYDYEDFRNNALISLHMKEKIYVYLNKSALHDYDIKFTPIFYKIVKVRE